MNSCKINNKYITGSYTVLFQVSFIAIFLSIFFFFYVTRVEKDEFQKQIDIIVNNILTDDEVNNLIPDNLTQDKKENLSILISGVIESAKQKSFIDEKQSINNVINSNNNIQSATYKKIYIVLIVLVVLSFIGILFGYCLPIAKEIYGALWVVFFVGITELVFLEIIAKNYISADPNKVRKALSESINIWLKKNQ